MNMLQHGFEYRLKILALSAILLLSFSVSYGQKNVLPPIDSKNIANEKTIQPSNGNGGASDESGLTTINVTIGANINGIQFTVDGVTYASQQVFSWIPGSSHSIQADSIYAFDTSSAWFWQYWTDGGSRIHNINPTHDMVVTEFYRMYHYLHLQDPNNIPGNFVPDEGYYAQDTCFSITYAFWPSRVQNIIIGWSGSGVGSYTGTEINPQICMGGNIYEYPNVVQCWAPMIYPNDTVFTSDGGTGTFRIMDTQYCDWRFDFVNNPPILDSVIGSQPMYGSFYGNAIAYYHVPPNPDTTNRYYIIGSFGDADFYPNVLNIFQTGRPANCIPTWQFTNTGTNHTIIIDTGSHPSWNGLQLNYGDYIGAFYDSNGTLACAGYSMWTGTGAISIAAFQNELSSPMKNGFDPGEVLQWKVWKCTQQKDFSAAVTYYAPNLIHANTNTFTANGISQIASFAGGNVSRYMTLRAGWSMISNALIPVYCSLDSLYGPVTDDLIILKNGEGKAYIPSIPVNSIGCWDVKEGYQIKMKNPRFLLTSGTKIVPELSPVYLSSGWSIIPYYRDSSSSTDVALQSLGGNLIIAKDQDGNVYMPSIPINTIGALTTGQGYQVKITHPDTLLYPHNSYSLSSIPPSSAKGVADQKPVHYQVKFRTDNNATLIVPLQVACLYMSVGDEIGVFSVDGAIIGAGRFSGDNIGIALWGRESLVGASEGLKDGEKYQMRIWDHTSGREQQIGNCTWTEGNEYYKANDIDIIARITSVYTSVNTVTSYGLRQNYPNPFNPTTTIGFTIPENMPVRIRIYNLIGELVSELINQSMDAGYHEVVFNSEGYPSGVYYYRLQAGSYMEARKMILMK